MARVRADTGAGDRGGGIATAAADLMAEHAAQDTACNQADTGSLTLLFDVSDRLHAAAIGHVPCAVAVDASSNDTAAAAIVFPIDRFMALLRTAMPKQTRKDAEKPTRR